MRILLVGRSGFQLAADLIQLGHETLTATDACDVLRIALFFDPQVIWIEEPLPDATAQVLASHLRRDVRLGHVTIVKHSEAPSEEDGLGDSQIDLCITRERFVATCRDLPTLRRSRPPLTAPVIPKILGLD